MRYRPFGHSGQALSAVGLRLDVAHLRKHTGQAEKLIMAALEAGINTYHFDAFDLAFLKEMAALMTVVERRLLFVSISPDLPGQPGDLAGYTMPHFKDRLRDLVKGTGFSWIDLLLLEQPGANYVPPESFTFLRDLKRAGMIRHIGAVADTADIKPLVATRQFSVIKTGFDIDSTWEKRHQIDHAIHNNICVIGADYFPDMYRKESDVVPTKARFGFFGGKPKDPLAGAGTHAFLHQTADWTPEELCLGYALSLPSLSCILIDAEKTEKVEALAAVPERHLPSSVPAQIEMARFTSHLPKGHAS